MNDYSIASLLKWSSSQLKTAFDNPNPFLDAEILLMHAIKRDRVFLHTYPEFIVPPAQAREFTKFINRRAVQEPVAYITNKQEFWSMPFYVDNRVLVPRPATETLVAAALELDLPDSARILDLGVGSGAISIALASERKNWQIFGVDSSADAIDVANKNRLHLLPDSNNICFLNSNWFSAVEDFKFHAILSNPPYIDKEDPVISDNNLAFEPSSSLFSSEKGMCDLNYIIKNSFNYMLDESYLLVEHGYNQYDVVVDVFLKYSYQNLLSLNDLDGIPRVVCGMHKFNSSLIV